MSGLSSLKAVSSLSEFAKLLRFKPSALSYILYKQSADTKYREFEIVKRNGGTRKIKAPIDSLKLLQQRLSVLLQDCVDDISRTTRKTDCTSHGFTRKRSIVTNAIEHRNRRFVFNIDLEDFFPSINFGRVRGYFMKDKAFSLNSAVATIIAQIACCDNVLPQGSPCSPVISNLIGHILDVHLVHLASQFGCSYSRYVDDITFSTNKKLFPDAIAVRSVREPDIWMPGSTLSRLVAHSGFRINDTKTHMQYWTSRQVVTGLTVNKIVNIRREYRHVVRAMVHRMLETGSFQIAGLSGNVVGTNALAKAEGTPNQMHGMLGFIDTIDVNNKKNTKTFSSELSKKEVMYRRFLLYRYFFAADRPIIIGEGETDGVYLTHAIRSLASSYPALAVTGVNKRVTLSVKIYKYKKSSTSRILGLRDGGNGSLANFLALYKRESATFKAPGQVYPVIILYDNDQGASKIRSAIKQACGKTLDGTEPYVHICQNMYGIATPLLNGVKESKIEDFFDAMIKSTSIGSKTFDPSNNLDSTTHYGKKAFAHSVVVPRANTIDFSAFRPLLINLSSIVQSHKQPSVLP